MYVTVPVFLFCYKLVLIFRIFFREEPYYVIAEVQQNQIIAGYKQLFDFYEIPLFLLEGLR